MLIRCRLCAAIALGCSTLILKNWRSGQAPALGDVADFDPGKPLFADAECELLSLGRWKCLESWLALKNLFPVAQEKYMCKFGAAPATEAVRISLTEVSQAHAFAFALLS